jgi:hypothetical protein
MGLGSPLRVGINPTPTDPSKDTIHSLFERLWGQPPPGITARPVNSVIFLGLQIDLIRQVLPDGLQLLQLAFAVLQQPRVVLQSSAFFIFFGRCNLGADVIVDCNRIFIGHTFAL